MTARLRAPLSVGLIAAGSLALALSAPLAASAHVTIDDNTAEAGSFTLITFKVPNESATATTSSIELTLPSDTPFPYVSYVPVPGWTTELVRTTLPEPVDDRRHRAHRGGDLGRLDRRSPAPRSPPASCSCSRCRSASSPMSDR